ncbi:MAG: hypothetical protein J6N92_05955 [Alloprevotella sp.]|nr:hypothetical protein [Alloprevotella sp.]
MYISRREIYIFSACDVHFPPRFITSWADRKTWKAHASSSERIKRTSREPRKGKNPQRQHPKQSTRRRESATIKNSKNKKTGCKGEKNAISLVKKALLFPSNRLVEFANSWYYQCFNVKRRGFLKLSGLCARKVVLLRRKTKRACAERAAHNQQT